MRIVFMSLVFGMSLIAGIPTQNPTQDPSQEPVKTPSQNQDQDYPSCGGFAGLVCPQGYSQCVDDPRDSCDPATGGADCAGICVM